jgi:hypothetical protein
MQVIANKQLTGDYGTVVAGQKFEVADDVAADLLQRSVVRRAEPPKVLYETKVIAPEAPEVAPRLPFRHSSLPDEGPAALATEGDRVLPVAGLSKQGTADPGRRRTSRGPGSGQ